MRLLTTIWRKWKLVARKIADFQARVLLFVFYFVVLGPFAVGVKMSSDPLRLHIKHPNVWLKRPEIDADALTLARRQF